LKRRAKVPAEQRAAARTAMRLAKRLDPMVYELERAEKGGGEFAAALLYDVSEKLRAVKHALERNARRLERYTSFDEELEGDRMLDLRDRAASGDPGAQSLLERRERGL
jgi:hypothetical protein